MLKRFHDRSSSQLFLKKNCSQLFPQTYQQLKRRKLSLKTNYSQKFRAKIQFTQQKLSSTLELIKTNNFLYQGYLINQKKHGEGVMMVKNGTTIIGRWQSDFLQGRAIIFTSLGCKILANFIQGKLNGWLIAQYKNKIVKYGEKLTYDENEKLWIAAKCSYDGKLISITHVEKGSLMQVPSFVQSKELKYLLNTYVLNTQHFVKFQNIRYIENSSTSGYIGYVDQEEKPCGLGVIHTNKQLYCGNFFEGTLQHYGRMLFENGEIYHGQMAGGAFWGRGIYYSPNKNETHILSSNENEQYTEKQLKGYVIIDINPNLGGDSSNSNKGIKGNILQILQQSFQPYYLRQYAHNTSQNSQHENLNHSEFGHSQDMSRDHKNDSRLEDHKVSTSTNQNKPIQKWLKFGQDVNFHKESNQKSHPFDKLEVGSIKNKQNISIIKHKPPKNEYQSIQIKQNLDEQQSEGFSKQIPPKTKIMEEISFNKFRGKDQNNIQNIKNNFQIYQQEFKFKQQQKMEKNSQISQSSSQISEKSLKINNLVERAKGYRKKIFY